jgi:DivIVA domain-containing protein
MTPAEIENKQFAVTRFKEGYDLEEVDDFLDRVAAHVRKLEQDLLEERQRVTQLKRNIAEQQRRLDEYNDLPTQQIPMQAARILEAAQRTADDVIHEAERQAADTTARAEENAQAAVAQAQSDARAVTYEARSKVEDAENQLAALQARRNALRLQMTDLLESLKEGLERDGEG